jgi:hypothetical protein
MQTRHCTCGTTDICNMLCCSALGLERENRGGRKGGVDGEKVNANEREGGLGG